MKEIDVLRELFDRKVISVVNVFLEYPERHFSLSEVSNMAKVHIATTFRVLNKLMEKDFVRIVLIGKSKFYQLKRGEKSMMLFRFLKKEGDQLSNFVDQVKEKTRVRKVVLETKGNNFAKILLVGNFLPTDKIKDIANDIKEKHSFKIDFVELTEKQFADMERLNIYDLNKKIIWERRD